MARVADFFKFCPCGLEKLMKNFYGVVKIGAYWDILLNSIRDKFKFSLNSSTNHTRDEILDKFYVFCESEI